MHKTKFPWQVNGLALAAFTFLLTACQMNGQVPSNNQNTTVKEMSSATALEERGPVLVELFTSQGCSSCPPADDVLQALSKDDDNIMALSYHVDYWNRLGWTDPYSQSAFSVRQRNYARQLPEHRVYTPQMVIDGRSGHVGSRRREVDQALKLAQQQQNSTQIEYQIEQLSNGERQLSYQLSGNTEDISLQIAIIETTVENNVPRGENRGRHLQHTNVVKTLLSQPGGTAQGTVTLPPSTEEGERIALFTQHEDALFVTGTKWVEE